VESNRAAIRKVCEFARSTTQLDLHRQPGEQLVSLIQSIFEVEAAAVFDADQDKVSWAGEWGANTENEIRNIYFFEKTNQDTETGLIHRVLRMGNLPVGALLMKGELSIESSDSIACIAAITFDRYHSFANVSRTESARQAEQLRTTVLDSLAHAYKTPLTAIRAASTGLSEIGHLAPEQSELVTLIAEQAQVLSELTSRLLQTARLEDHHLTVRKEAVAVAPLIEDAIANLSEHLADFSIKIVIEGEDFNLNCDRALAMDLLVQYLENAGKYATAGSTITVRATEDDGKALLSVHNIGPVIPLSDYERIFDRYYRCTASSSQVPGTGIGLSVARRAAQAHGGDVWVVSDPTKGTTFFASLPVIVSGGENA
jgi:two-component system sensor histidine kinase KdpD